MKHPVAASIRWFLLLALIVHAQPARAADWYESYARAERAIKDEDWNAAIEQINLALEQKGDSSARARTYGMNFAGYFPYLKLGVAYYHLDQLDAALHALETEERLGAIEASVRDLAELRSVRAQIVEARKEIAAEEQRRIRQIVDDASKRARALEAEGRLEDAIRVLGEAIAVAPDDAEIDARIKALRVALAERIEQADLEAQTATLLEQGRQLHDAERFGEAAAIFDRAFALQPSDEIRRLRDGSRQALSERIEAAASVERRALMISEGLDEVSSLEGAGDLVAALDRLQSVLALAPDHEQALALRTRLAAAQADADRERSRTRLIGELEGQIASRLEGGEYDEALAATNRLLAFDPGNAAALEHVATAYRRINARLLGRGAVEFPPAIRFADFRETLLDDGLEVERVSSPSYRLAGTVFDDSAVQLTFELAGHDTAGEAAPVEGRTEAQQVGNSTIHEFSISRSLAPGISLFRVVAVDEAGLKSSSEYAVLYVRPFHRSAWFYAVLASVGLVAMLTFAARRSRRRRALRRRRFNPYTAGAPVLDENLFFGREELLERILQRIPNNSLLLFGERRIGKTSLQHHLKRRLDAMRDPDYEFYTAYIDLQGTPQERFFFTLAHEIFADLAPVLGDLPPVEEPPPGSSYGYTDMTRDLRRLLQALRARSSKQVKLILLIDEVDELNAYDPRVNQKLRSLFMKSFADSLVAVVSGVSIKRHWESEGSPWYNFFEEIEVRPLDHESAEALIRRPIGDLFRLEDGVVERVIELTEGKPYLIQKICIELVDRLHREKRRTITVADVNSIGPPREA